MDKKILSWLLFLLTATVMAILVLSVYRIAGAGSSGGKELLELKIELSKLEIKKLNGECNGN